MELVNVMSETNSYKACENDNSYNDTLHKYRYF